MLNVVARGAAAGPIRSAAQSTGSALQGSSATSPLAAVPLQSRRPTQDPHVRIWDLRTGTEQPIVANQPSEFTDPVARQAFQNARKVDKFFRTTFNRDGWDGKGAPLDIVVHTPDVGNQPLNNAVWNRTQSKVYLGDGDGTVFSPLGGALDVMTHEFTHAIVDSEVHLRYSGQQGGINESWADVMGKLADGGDWKIGKSVFTPGVPGDAIRDLEHPRFSNVAMLPKDADIDVHDLSGIPSLAAVMVAEKVGRPQMGQIWYTALTKYLNSQSGFAGAARATLNAATDLYGNTSKEFAAVRDAWKAVGVDARLSAKASALAVR